MLKQGTLLSELQSIVGKKHAREPRNDQDGAVDGLSPKAIVEPGSYDEVADVLRFANVERLAVIPRGGGRQADLGNVPSRYDIALSLVRLDGVIEHEPADLTVTCQTGIEVKALQDSLIKQGQRAPFSFHLARQSTLGGTLATNNPGASGLSLGTPRDFTIGMRVVTGDGVLTKAGGQVVKNVAGYDLCKLFIGSRGTLGAIVEATLKVMPFREASPALRWMRSFEAGCAMVMELSRRGLNIQSAVVANKAAVAGLVDDRPSPLGFAYLEFGESNADERLHSEVGSAGGAHAIEGPLVEYPHRALCALATPSGDLSMRISVPAAFVPKLAAAIEELVPSAHIFAQPVTGTVKLYFPDTAAGFNALQPLRASVTSAGGGSLVVETCPPELKRRIDVFGPPPPSFPLMRAIKQQFDPNNVLSPGRFVGRL